MRIRLRDAQLTLATVGFERYAKTTRLDRLWSTSIQVTKVVNVDIGREITKEKERIGEALARVDAQRESSPVSSANWRRLSGCSRATAKARGQQGRPQPGRPGRTPQRADAGAAALRPQDQPPANARRPSVIRSSPWQRARHRRKSPPLARALARTMSASSSLVTSAPAASKSATGNATLHSRPGRSNAPRSDPRDKRIVICAGSSSRNWRVCSTTMSGSRGKCRCRRIVAPCTSLAVG